ncbi:alpha/beta hydrolase [Sphingosinicella rhizophila]|uniref:Alpha/beta hydrolase-fold protein n=1 Tax=Sphingosinicella rhizophila TaxID=3050082 RepID=A0ABU3Q2T0_9SPHN|nr:alpha/beta hydrolase-fold protein [Sphingosinicella sp. GR2756]MDT9597379.1 alpha/beta hydrolase-fold protein [Sphingosinicella sp. GR2756]
MTIADFKTTGSPWPLRNSEAFEYHSKAVGADMAIGTWSPSPEHFARFGQGNPELDIVYVLDASFMLGMAAGNCMLQYADLIDPGFKPVLLVGLDYLVGQVNARSRDYTMADSFPPAMMDALASIPKLGGAGNFLAFLEDELDPFIRSKYNVSDRPAAILGDSWGGTFTFYAFLQQSKLFDRYWLGSPGIFTTDNDYIAQLEERLKGKLVHPTKMFLSMGSREMDGGVDFYEDMGRNYQRLVSVLEKAGRDDLEYKSKIYDGYTHTSVVAPSLNDALLYLLGK